MVDSSSWTLNCSATTATSDYQDYNTSASSSNATIEVMYVTIDSNTTEPTLSFDEFGGEEYECDYGREREIQDYINKMRSMDDKSKYRYIGNTSKKVKGKFSSQVRRRN